jgi:uncharacterized membrane protein
VLLENSWTDAELAKLPVKGGFRLRGLAMTRLETFADAAFAFAVTMLVISIDSIPGNLAELVEALKGVPAFAASFASIMLLWAGHNRWSRRYGLEDGPTTLLTLCLIFIMLVFLYPLKLVFSALFAWISGGWMPSQFAIESAGELAALFIVYGIGFFTISVVIVLLYLRALKVADLLRLDEVEVLRTKEEVEAWSIMCGAGILSALFAWLVPGHFKVFAGFVYFVLPVAMPWVAIRYQKRAEALHGARASAAK